MSEPGSDSRPISRGPGEIRLDELVFECLERIESGGAVALEEMCREHPGHARALRERIEALRAFGLMPLEPSEPLGADLRAPPRAGEPRGVRAASPGRASKPFRRLRSALALSALSLLLAAPIAYGLLERRERRELAAEHEALRREWQSVVASRQRSLQSLRALVEASERELALLPHAEAARTHLLEGVLACLATWPAGAADGCDAARAGVLAGEILARLSRYEEADRSLERALERLGGADEGESGELHLERAAVWRTRGVVQASARRPAEAERCALRSLASFEAAERCGALPEAALAGRIEARLVLAEALLAAGSTSEAREASDAARSELERSPASTSASAELRAKLADLDQRLAAERAR